MPNLDEVEQIVYAYLADVLENTKFSSLKALDVRFGTTSSSKSITKSLTIDGAEYTSSAITIGASILERMTGSFSLSIVDKTLLCLAYGTTVYDGIHIILTFRHQAGKLEEAKAEFSKAIGTFNARYNPNYK